MNPIIQKIISEKHKEIEKLKGKGAKFHPISKHALRSFKRAIKRSDALKLIGEIKFSSPSEGRIRDMEDVLHLAKAYEEEGASAISVITERHFFGGSMDFLKNIKQGTGIPLLRKDFIIDPIQIQESVDAGADAVLLISRILEKKQLRELIKISDDMGISALTEVHDEHDIAKAIECGADIIGINNRDLETFNVDIMNTIRLLPLIPDNCLTVSESGIKGKQDVHMLKSQRVDAMLVGTSIMKSRDIRKKIRELISAGT